MHQHTSSMQTAECNIFLASPSVCLAVTLWYCVEINALVIKDCPPSRTSMTSFFQYCHYKIPWRTPSVGSL